MEYEKYMAVIQAGGKGTRMVALTKDIIPKPMILLNDKPMIQWQIENIAEYGIKEFVIIIGHLGKKIRDFFGDGHAFNVHISYIEEKDELGSAGALYFLKQLHKDKDFLLVFGDVMFDIDWERMIDFHEMHKGIATLLVHPNAHPYDSDLVVLGEGNQVIGIDSKKKVRDYWYENIVNSGIYIFDRKALDIFDKLRKLDLEKDIIAPLILKENVYGYHTTEYVKDAGTIERFQKACIEQKEGIWKDKNLSRKQRCVFLDRDGTINKYCGLISEERDFELEENVAEAIRRINESGHLAIVVTNQPVVARGMCEIDCVQKIHRKMQTLLGHSGAYLDDIVFCPHHPDKGYQGEKQEYKIQCKCRKPEIGMIELMALKYNIDISKSYMIGDTTVDIQTGKNAGLTTILLATGQAGTDSKYDVLPDYKASDLLEAVDIIVKCI